MKNVFYPDTAQERYGFGAMAVGDVVAVDLDGENKRMVQIHAHSHGQYHGKKFKTKELDGILYIKRIF